MAQGAARRTVLFALVGAGMALALLRFPLGRGTHGVWTVAIAAASLLLLGLPVLVAEMAVGQYRRRNAVDAFGPGAWKGLGGALAVGALLAAALVAVLAGWAAHLTYDSFNGDGFGDPGRHVRLLQAGPDALLWTLGVLAAATLLSMRGARRGLNGAVGALTVLAIAVLAGLALWANLQDGSGAGRSALFGSGGPKVTASSVVDALLAGLLPALLATGLGATLAAHVHERTLPREAALVAGTQALLVLLALLFLGPLAAAHGAPLGDVGRLQAFTQAPTLFATIGGAEGGMLQGLFFAAVLMASLVALLALLEVPMAWLTERFASWTDGRASLAAGLAAYLAAVPFCFSASAVARLDEALAWVAAPLAALFVSAHVGWGRPEVLDGFRVGEAGHRLDRSLGPALRYVLPPAFALLLAAGLLGFLRAAGWVHGGSGGLWALAP